MRLLHRNKGAMLCFIICLSPMFYGYCLTNIGAANLTYLFPYYHVTLSKQTTLSMLNGLLPIGGVFGCLLFPKVRLLATKRYMKVNM